MTQTSSANTVVADIASASLPPLDGTLTVDQLYDWHRVHSGHLPCIRWSHHGTENGGLTWEEMAQGIDKAFALITKNVIEASRTSSESVEGSTNNKKPAVVGVFSNTDAVTYSAFLLALVRLTHPQSEKFLPSLLPFPISPRNSPAVIAHLLRTSDVRYVYVDDGQMRNLLYEAITQDTDDQLKVKVLKMPNFLDLYSTGPYSSTIFSKSFRPVPLDTPAIIVHSSGSTAYPKAITISHRSFLELACSAAYGELNFKGEVLAVHASPAYHGMGLLTLAWSATTLMVRAVPCPYVNIPPPSPEYFMSQIVASGATMVFCVPSFAEAWSQDEDSVCTLQGLKSVMYSGAPLSKTAGTYLHSKGVKLICLLGLTECTQVSSIPSDPYPEGHEWFSFASYTDPSFVPQDEDEDNTFEVVFRQSPGHHPSVLNMHIDGVPAYATNDLVEQHPTNKNLWRVKGRKDDQLMLSIGEKTNPGPIETHIRKNKHVKGAVVFGRGHFQNGVLIEPVSWEGFPTPEQFREAAWPSIEEANTFSPSHSRIFKEMVLVSSPAKPFPYTLKGTPRRPPILKDYEPEIEELYAAVKESSQIDIPAPVPPSSDLGWSVDDAVGFVHKVVLRVMKNSNDLGINDDFFKSGCDSLEATYIRNSILRALRESTPEAQAHKLPSNFVYEHPSIQRLGIYVAQISGGNAVSNESPPNSNQARAEEMNDMVRKYVKDFPVHEPSTEAAAQTGEVLLLTGSTGGLGSQILVQLLALRSISKIYAFNRPSKAGMSPCERQRHAFLDRGNDLALLDSKKIVFVEGDTGVEGFGISERLLDEIRVSVTTIIHNAWQVDFKMTLSSFEPAVRGVRNLIDLVLRSPRSEPPRVVFTSSIGILRNWLPDRVPEAPVSDPSLVRNSGYAESKWVSECILLEAAAATPLKPVIVRVGQLSGGLNGCWNVQEWFPSLVRGSQILGSIPENKGLVAWIPLDVAAAALVELRNASSSVVHLVHPRPVPWSIIAKQISETLGLSLSPYADWVSQLQTEASRHYAVGLIPDNPALRLLDFYKASTAPNRELGLENREVLGLATLESQKTVLEAPSLNPEKLAQLGGTDVDKWVSYWRQKGLLD